MDIRSSPFLIITSIIRLFPFFILETASSDALYFTNTSMHFILFDIYMPYDRMRAYKSGLNVQSKANIELTGNVIVEMSDLPAKPQQKSERSQACFCVLLVYSHRSSTSQKMYVLAFMLQMQLNTGCGHLRKRTVLYLP